MGEFMNGESPEQLANLTANPPVDRMSVDTDVENVKADGTRDGLPVFNVEKDEFYQNMMHGRKRLRFKSPSVTQYMQQTRYKRPFYISHEDHIRKVK